MNQFQSLRELITARFDRNELQNLYFDLGIDFEEASNERKSELVRHLIDACRQQGRLPDLIALCKQRRPAVDWPDLVEDDFGEPETTLQTRTRISSILKQILVGGLYGAIAGAILGTTAALTFILFEGGFNLLLLVFGALAGGIVGVPFGMLLSLIDLDGPSNGLKMGALGAAGGLLIGLFFGMIARVLFPAAFVSFLVFGLFIGVSTAVTVWAVRNLYWQFYPKVTIREDASRKGKRLYAYGVMWNVIAGAAIGMLAGALGGLLIEIVLGQESLFGTVSAIEVPPSMTGTLTIVGMGLAGGAIFLTVYRVLSAEMPPPVVESPKLKWSLIAILGTIGIAIFAIGIRPIGHALLVQQSEKPYVAREYIGRVLDGTNRPVSGANVTVILGGIPIETVTDGNGTYRFSVTAREDSLSGRLIVTSRLYGEHEKDIVLEPGTTTLADVHLGPIVLPTIIREAP